MKHTLILYVTTFIVMAVFDMTWLGVIAHDFYRSRISGLDFRAVPAVLFYVIYIAGVLVFVSGGAGATWRTTLLYGALFGFFAYSTYDLSNLATLKGWPVAVTVVDIAWGCFATACASTVGLLAANYLEGK